MRGGASPVYSAVPKSQELGFPAEMDFPATFFWGGGGVSGATSRKLPNILIFDTNIPIFWSNWFNLKHIQLFMDQIQELLRINYLTKK